MEYEEEAKKQLKIDISNWINEYQEHLENKNLYYLSDYHGNNYSISKEKQLKPLKKSNIEITTYSEFIIDFLLKHNNDKISVDSVSGRSNCSTKRRRSAYDIYLITKFYYPSVTFKEVLMILCILVENYSINASYCSDICKYVFYTSKISDYSNLLRRFEFADNNQITLINLITYFKNE